MQPISSITYYPDHSTCPSHLPQEEMGDPIESSVGLSSQPTLSLMEKALEDLPNPLSGPIEKLEEALYLCGEACTHHLGGAIYGSKDNVRKIAEALEGVGEFHSLLHKQILESIRRANCIIIPVKESGLLEEAKDLALYMDPTVGNNISCKLNTLKPVIVIDLERIAQNKIPSPVVLMHEWIHCYSDQIQRSIEPNRGGNRSPLLCANPCRSNEEGERLLEKWLHARDQWLQDTPKRMRLETPGGRMFQAVDGYLGEADRAVEAMDSLPPGEAKKTRQLLNYRKLKIAEAQSEIPAYLLEEIAHHGRDAIYRNAYAKPVCEYLDQLYGEKIFTQTEWVRVAKRYSVATLRWTLRGLSALSFALDLHHSIKREMELPYHFNSYIPKGILRCSARFISNNLMCRFDPTLLFASTGSVEELPHSTFVNAMQTKLQDQLDVGSIRSYDKQPIKPSQYLSAMQEHLKNWLDLEEKVTQELTQAFESHFPSDPDTVFTALEDLQRAAEPFKITQECLLRPEIGSAFASQLRVAAEKSMKGSIESSRTGKPTFPALPKLQPSRVSYFPPFPRSPAFREWNIVQNVDVPVAAQMFSIEDPALAQQIASIDPGIIGSEEFQEKLAENIVYASEVVSCELPRAETPREESSETGRIAGGEQPKMSPRGPTLSGVSFGPLGPALPNSFGVVGNFEGVASVGLGVNRGEKVGKSLEGVGVGGTCVCVTVELSKEGIAALVSANVLLGLGIGIGVAALGYTLEYFYHKKQERTQEQIARSLSHTERQQSLVREVVKIIEDMQHNAVRDKEADRPMASLRRHLFHEKRQAVERAEKAGEQGNKIARNAHIQAVQEWSGIYRKLQNQGGEFAERAEANKRLAALEGKSLEERLSILLSSAENNNKSLADFYFVLGLREQIRQQHERGEALSEESSRTLSQMEGRFLRKPGNIPLFVLDPDAYGQLDKDTQGDIDGINERIASVNCLAGNKGIGKEWFKVFLLDYVTMQKQKVSGKKIDRQEFRDERGRKVRVCGPMYNGRNTAYDNFIDFLAQWWRDYEQLEAEGKLEVPLSPIDEKDEEPSILPQIEGALSRTEPSPYKEVLKETLELTRCVAKEGFGFLQLHASRYAPPLQRKIVTISAELNALAPDLFGMSLLYPGSRWIGQEEVWEEVWREKLDQQFQSIQHPWHSLENFSAAMQSLLSVCSIAAELVPLKEEEAELLRTLQLGTRVVRDISKVYSGYHRYVQAPSQISFAPILSVGLNAVVDLTKYAVSDPGNREQETPGFHLYFELLGILANTPLLLASPGQGLVSIALPVYRICTKGCEEEALKALLTRMKQEGSGDSAYKALESFIEQNFHSDSNQYFDGDREIVKEAKRRLFNYKIQKMFQEGEIESIISKVSSTHFPPKDIVFSLLIYIQAILVNNEVKPDQFWSKFREVEKTVNGVIKENSTRRDRVDSKAFQKQTDSLKEKVAVLRLSGYLYELQKHLGGSILSFPIINSLLTQAWKESLEVGKKYSNQEEYCGNIRSSLQQLYDGARKKAVVLAYHGASKLSLRFDPHCNDFINIRNHIQLAEQPPPVNFRNLLFDANYLTMLGAAKLQSSDLRGALRTLDRIPFGSRTAMTWYYIAEVICSRFYSKKFITKELSLIGHHHLHIALDVCATQFFQKYEQKAEEEKEALKPIARWMKGWKQEIGGLKARDRLLFQNEDPDQFIQAFNECKALETFDFNRSYPLSRQALLHRSRVLKMKLFNLFCLCTASLCIFWRMLNALHDDDAVA